MVYNVISKRGDFVDTENTPYGLTSSTPDIMKVDVLFSNFNLISFLTQ